VLVGLDVSSNSGIKKSFYFFKKQLLLVLAGEGEN
jgi:hypothetical protein